MKIFGIIIGSLFAAGNAVANVCPPVCANCGEGGIGADTGVGLLIVAIGAFGLPGLFRLNVRGVRCGVLAVLLTLPPAFALNARAEDDAAAAAPAKATIAEILQQPGHYAGKVVVVTARLADVCTDDGCMTLKDKFDVIEGVPPDGGFKSMPKAGSTLKVSGTVKVRGAGDRKVVVLVVTGFEEVKK